MTIFLWIFLTPFIAIGTVMIGGFLSCIAGTTEIRVEAGRVGVFTAIGPLRWTRRFEASELGNIRIRETRNNNNSNGKEIVAELKGGRLIKFGSMLRDDRRSFLASAAEKIIRGHGATPLRNPIDDWVSR